MTELSSKNQNRYNHSKVYKLVERETNTFYIGSTTSSLSKRLHEHKQDAKRQPERHVYKYLNATGWDNVEIILINEYILNSKDELRREEDKIIQQFIKDDLCLNSCRAFKTHAEKEEYWKSWHHDDYKNKREMYKQNHEQYRNKHLEEEKIRTKKYREENLEKIKEKKREYYKENAASILQKQKEYHEKNAEKLNEKNICECGGHFTTRNKHNHIKSKKHITFLNNK